MSKWRYETVSTKFGNQRRGPQVKNERVVKRREAIKKAEEVGIAGDEATETYLKENYPDVIRKGKNGWLDPKWYMDDYRRFKRHGAPHHG